jgi:hypothetical protein
MVEPKVVTKYKNENGLVKITKCSTLTLTSGGDLAG